ncbi:MAG: hypothetical protein KBT09_09940 [Bacteroidales bacterium]|nr:hypothetical protein [Candidatus Sodaliphilus fimicaballi]
MKKTSFIRACFFICLLILGISFISCNDEPTANDEPAIDYYGTLDPGTPISINPPQEPCKFPPTNFWTDEESKIINQLIKFETNLFVEACKLAGHENCVISPFLTELTLVAILNSTADENIISGIKKTMALENFTTEDINNYFSHAVKLLYEADPYYTEAVLNNLVTINSKFAQEICPNFSLFLKNRFLSNTKFSNDVNGLTFNTTYNLNAQVYDCGEIEKNTQETFYNYDNTTTTVEMMNGMHDINRESKDNAYVYVADTQKYKVLCGLLGWMWYGMTFLIPNEGTELEDLLDLTSWGNTYSMYGEVFNIQIPVIKIESEVSMVETLKAMGLNFLFDSNGIKLDRILKQNAQIVDIKHNFNINISDNKLEGILHLRIGDTCQWFDWMGTNYPKGDFIYNKPFIYHISAAGGLNILSGKIEKM